MKIERNGRQYKMQRTLMLTKSKTERFWKIMVPRRDKDLLIRKFHIEKGHFGSKKTLHAMRRCFFWKKIRRDVQDYIYNFMRCMETKPYLRKTKTKDYNIGKTLAPTHLYRHHILFSQVCQVQIHITPSRHSH